MPDSVLTCLMLVLVFCGARVLAGLGSGFRAAFVLVGFGAAACFRPAAFCSLDAAFGLVWLDAQGPVLPPGTRPGTVVPRGGAATVLAGMGTLALASFPFVRGLVAFGSSGEVVRELGVGVRGCGVVAAALGVGVAAARVAVRARLAASRRRREAGEPGRRCARRERWLAPEGGRASLAAAGRPGAAMGRGTEAAMGEAQGLEGLGHLEEGSGQMGLLG